VACVLAVTATVLVVAAAVCLLGTVLASGRAVCVGVLGGVRERCSVRIGRHVVVVMIGHRRVSMRRPSVAARAERHAFAVRLGGTVNRSCLWWGGLRGLNP
jgi:hypothetical protein